MDNQGLVVGPEISTRPPPTSTCIHRPRHSSSPCRQRPIPHSAGSPISDFKETEPSHLKVQRSRRKAKGRTPNVILANGYPHQEAGRRSIKNSTNSDSIIWGRTLTKESCAKSVEPASRRRKNTCSYGVIISGPPLSLPRTPRKSLPTTQEGHRHDTGSGRLTPARTGRPAADRSRKSPQNLSGRVRFLHQRRSASSGCASQPSHRTRMSGQNTDAAGG